MRLGHSARFEVCLDVVCWSGLRWPLNAWVWARWGGGGDASWHLFGCVDLCSCADMFFFMFGVCQCAKSRVEMHDVYVACLCD